MGKKLFLVGLLGVVLAVAVGVWFQLFVIEPHDWTAEVNIKGSNIKFQRRGPIMEMWGDDDAALAKALGYAHAKDRLVQMVFQRLIGQGRLTECLVNEPKVLKTDMLFRELGFARDAHRAIKHNVLSKEVLNYLQAYADGVNYYMDQEKERFSWDALALPLEFTLVAHTPEPWKPEDTLATLKLMCYVGLAQLQGDVEKFIMQSIKGGVDLDKIKAIFAPHLSDLNDELVDLIKKVEFHQPLLSERFREAGGLPMSFPVFAASNNWVVSPSLTKEGSAIQCNDPHLEINRLPGIWYEILFHYNNNKKEDKEQKYWFGVTVPGIPGVIMGRTHAVTYGFTYGYMDQLDYFIEEVKDGKYKRIGENGTVEWKEFEIRHERIKLKGDGKPLMLTFFETENGILELSDPTQNKPPSDGLHLRRAWSWGQISDADFSGLIPPPYFTSVEEVQEKIRGLAFSTNFLSTDREGNIGYQQTGRLPARGAKHGGLSPAIGWNKDYQWSGNVEPEKLYSFVNPPEGFIVTANDLWQSPDPSHPTSLTMHMGPNRRHRAEELIKNLKSKGIPITPEHMKTIQLDLYSKEAEYYMNILRPLLPPTPAGQILKDWDLRYNKESQGATLFELFWERTLAEVFGNMTLGHDAFTELRGETGFFLIFHWFFDRILTANTNQNEKGLETVDNIPWFGKEGREAMFKRIANELFSEKVYSKKENVPTYANYHNTILKNILFDGKLPLWTGFDAGPIALEGNRNTLVQGNIFKMFGRLSSFAPSWRFISEVNKDVVLSSLPSGPSGKRFSSLYYNMDYFAGKYTETKLHK